MSDPKTGREKKKKGILSKSTSKVVIITSSVVLFFAGVASVVGFSATLENTNTTEFCTSCHSLQWVTDEYKQSVHYKNTSGVGAGCPDCHVPKNFGLKVLAKLGAYSDILHEVKGTINTKDKFEARRWHLAEKVWEEMRENNSRECRSCHDFTKMDFKEQDRYARKKHQRAVDGGKTCIDCHKGIAHEQPMPPPEHHKSAMLDADNGNS